MYYDKVNNKEYFNFSKFIDKNKNYQFYIIFGQRSNGKTYSTLIHLIDNFFNNGTEFIYIRRHSEDIRGKFTGNVFNELSDYIKEKYNHNIRFYNSCWYVSPCEVEQTISNSKILGRAFSIAQSERLKSTSYPNVEYIMFEEFIATQGYLNNEVNLFINIISTVFRDRTNGKVILLGNTISKQNPYTEGIGVSLKDFKKGETKVINEIKDNIRTNIIIHRSKDNDIKKIKEIKTGYTSFGNSDFSSMIHKGDFECRKGVRHINGMTHDSLKNKITDLEKKDIKVVKFKTTGIYLNYLDLFYRFSYYKNERNLIGLFTKHKGLLGKSCTILITPNKHLSDIKGKYYLVNNFNSLPLKLPKKYMYDIDILRQCVNTDFYLTENDDQNEDILKIIESV